MEVVVEVRQMYSWTLRPAAAEEEEAAATIMVHLIVVVVAAAAVEAVLESSLVRDIVLVVDKTGVENPHRIVACSGCHCCY